MVHKLVTLQLKLCVPYFYHDLDSKISYFLLFDIA